MNIKTMRVEAGLTQDEVANAMGICRPTYNLKEKEDNFSVAQRKYLENYLRTDKDIDTFLKIHSDYSPISLEEILETLEDFGFLNENGKRFKTNFWRKWIKK